jgi:hypothetical protein
VRRDAAVGIERPQLREQITSLRERPGRRLIHPSHRRRIVYARIGQFQRQ